MGRKRARTVSVACRSRSSRRLLTTPRTITFRSTSLHPPKPVAMLLLGNVQEQLGPISPRGEALRIAPEEIVIELLRRGHLKVFTSTP
jgi:hypothetical protein